MKTKGQGISVRIITTPGNLKNVICGGLSAAILFEPSAGAPGTGL